MEYDVRGSENLSRKELKKELVDMKEKKRLKLSCDESDEDGECGEVKWSVGDRLSEKI